MDPFISIDCLNGITDFQSGNIDPTNLDMGELISEEEMGSKDGGNWCSRPVSCGSLRLPEAVPCA